MKTRILIAAGLTAAVTSSAFAAGFDVNQGQDLLADVSTGTVTVDDCTDSILLDVVPGKYDADAGDWALASLRLTAATAGVDLAEACTGFQINATIETGKSVVNASADGQGTPAIAATEVTLVPDAYTLLRDVHDVAVLVDQPDLVPVARASAAPTSVGEIAHVAQTVTRRAYGSHQVQNVAPVYSTTGLDLFGDVAACPEGGEGLVRWMSDTLEKSVTQIGLTGYRYGPGTGLSPYHNKAILLDAHGNELASSTDKSLRPVQASAGQQVFLGVHFCMPVGADSYSAIDIIEYRY